MPPLLLAVAAALRASTAPPPVPPPAHGMVAVQEYRLKAEFLERFTHFVRWPERAEAGRPAPPPPRFVLCVAGEDPFGDSLQQLARTRRVDERPIELRHVAAPADAASCQLLFIAASEKPHLDALLHACDGHGVLTVADSDGFAEHGVMINLFVAEQKIGFEVNQQAARREGFELSAKLLKLARLVNGERGGA